MKDKLRSWLEVKEMPVIYIGLADYVSEELAKQTKALDDVGLHVGEGGVVNMNGVSVKFSDRLEDFNRRLSKLEMK